MACIARMKHIIEKLIFEEFRLKEKIKNESGEEITTNDFAYKVPKGMFRDLYEKYADKIIIDTISGLIQEAGDYESDW